MSSDYVFQCKLNDTGRIEYGYWVLKELLIRTNDTVVFPKFPNDANCQDYVYKDGEIIYSPIIKPENITPDIGNT